MKKRIADKEYLDSHKSNKYWDFGNDILYNLCKNYFEHNEEKVILTKALFIGRIYAAAIERRKINKMNNDYFYIEKIAPAFKNSKIDEYLLKLKSIKTLSFDNLQQVLEVHQYLITTLFEITGMDKRSFSSKYLHFHLPELFFIYDSRSVSALSSFTKQVPKDLQKLTSLKNVDAEYAKFFCKCFDLKTKIEKLHNIPLTNRQLDNMLIEVANEKVKLLQE